MDANQKTGNGIGLATVIGIVFIILKLTGNIDWSWWWVLLPIYGPWVLVACIWIIVIAIAVIAEVKGRRE